MASLPLYLMQLSHDDMCVCACACVCVRPCVSWRRARAIERCARVLAGEEVSGRISLSRVYVPANARACVRACVCACDLIAPTLEVNCENPWASGSNARSLPAILFAPAASAEPGFELRRPV